MLGPLSSFKRNFASNNDLHVLILAFSISSIFGTSKLNTIIVTLWRDLVLIEDEAEIFKNEPQEDAKGFQSLEAVIYL